MCHKFKEVFKVVGWEFSVTCIRDESLWINLNIITICIPDKSIYIAKKIKDKCKNYDIIIGAIADDKMNEALSRFSNYTLTDKGLAACMKFVDFGNQYVAKTEFACSKIEILDEKGLYGAEAKAINDYAYNQRNICNNIVKEMVIKYRNNGLYLDEIISNELKKQNIKENLDCEIEDFEYEL